MRFSLLLSGSLLLSAVLLGCGRAPAPPPPEPQVTEAAPTVEPPPRRAGRPAKRVKATVVERVRQDMGGDAREERCGPYRLVTDVREGWLLAACERIGARLDATFVQRFGIEPVGEPAETLFLFADRSAFRTFLARDGALSPGYAGVARGALGFLALTPDGFSREQTLATLAHEMTHLVLRRALGSDLPRWLSEGLADGLGDTATEQGFGPMVGLEGVEEEARRLAWGYSEGRVRSVARLVAASRSEFDKAPLSFDYEQSAILVRYLLQDGSLSHRFRAYLKQMAADESYSPESLRAALEVEWSRIDAALQAWVR